MPERIFAAQLKEWIPNLRRYAQMLTHDPVRADDLVQDTLVRALAKWREYVPGTNLRAWLSRTMHNIYIDQIRAQGRQQRPGLPVGEPVASDDPSIGVVIRDLKRALAQMPPEHSRALVLCGYHGFSYVEAAAAEGVPVGTISSRLAYGRAELRALMQR